MIIEVRAKNCYAFEDEITFSMKADMRNKKFDVILIRFRSFSILYGFENSGFSTHYFSFHTLLVPIQYQLFFVTIVCSSGGLQVI